MHRRILVAFTYCFVASAIAASRAQTPSPQAQPQTATVPADNDPIKKMVDRLDLEKYKATIKGLTQFGDRRQGTDRNRAAVDWIEAQLKSYGCTNTERIKYDYQPPAGRGTAAAGQRAEGAAPGEGQDAAAAGGQRGRGRGAQGGGRPRGIRARTGVNIDPNLQPDEKLRALNSQPTTPGPREEVYCTKVGTTHPDEMYIVGSAHGRARLGRGCQRRRIGHGAGDGAGARLQQPRRADRAFDPVRALEQRGDGIERRTRVRRSAQGSAGQGGSGRLGEVSGAEVARDGPARHDDVRPRHAARRRHGQQGAATGSGREHRVPDDRKARAAGAGARVGVPGRQREIRDRLPGRGRQPHDEHRLDAVHGPRAGDQPARERARDADRQRLGSALASADGRVSPLSATRTSASA